MTSPAEQRLGEALRDLAATQPFEPDPAAIERRGRHLRNRAVTYRIAAACIVAVVAVTVGATVGPHLLGSRPITIAAAQPTAQQTLERLIAHLRTAPKAAGDTTLVGVHSAFRPGGSGSENWSLFTDSGTEYGTLTRAGLPAQIALHRGLNAANSTSYSASAAHLDPAVVRKQIVGHMPTASADGLVWIMSRAGLMQDAGDPMVRLGALRLLFTLQHVAVTKSTTAGQATLTLTATWLTHTTVHPADTPFDTDTLIINADTGVLVADVQHIGGDPFDLHNNYQISRVTLADVAAGKF